jgi:formylmethanofuran dehydrogenase subunit C
VSETIVLTLRAPLERMLDLSAVAADRFAALAEREIAGQPVRYGGLAAALGDFVVVRGERSTRLRLEGDFARADGIGTGMAGGEITILGPVGRDAGLALAGGTIDVRGSAGPNAGGAPPGAARGMTGGEIMIRGSAGEEVGAAMRRGLIVVMEDAGRGMGRGMIAGTVVVMGNVGPGAGRFVKRGSIVAFGALAPPATFRYACTYRPPHLGVLLRSLRARHGLPFTDAHVAGRYHRYSGDFAELGRGEILHWAEAQS